MSTDPVTEHADTVATTFRSFWATVEDPEGDDTYNVTFYINGNRTEFSVFGTANDVALQAATDADFGASVGNFLVLSMPSAGNDGDIQIDWFAYKAGVHPPSVVDCAPCENTPPDAAVSVDPGTTVELDGGPLKLFLAHTPALARAALHAAVDTVLEHRIVQAPPRP